MTYLSKIWRGGCAVCDSHQHCADSPIESRRKASLGSHTHKYTNTHINAQIFMYRMLAYNPSDMRKCVHACLHRQKERKRLLTDIFYLKQSMTLWPLSCRSGKRTVAESVKAKHSPKRQEQRLHDIRRLSYTCA